MCSCVEGIVKYFLFITNLLIFLLGVVTLGLAIWIIADSPSFLGVLNQVDVSVPIYQSAAIIIIVVCVLVIFISFFGCCGAAKENRCMLGTYFGFVLVLLILLTVGAIMGFSGDWEDLKKPFTESLEAYDPDSSKEVDKALVAAWDELQQDFKCCGVDRWTDWSENNDAFKPGDDNGYTGRTTSRRPFQPYTKPPYIPKNHPVTPESCCDPSKDQETCAMDHTSANGAYLEGCLTLVVDEIKSHSGIVGGIAIGVVVVMILNAIIAFYMCTCGYNGDSDRPRKRMYGRTATRDV